MSWTWDAVKGEKEIAGIELRRRGGNNKRVRLFDLGYDIF
jgi:hypothetical protein